MSCHSEGEGKRDNEVPEDEESDDGRRDGEVGLNRAAGSKSDVHPRGEDGEIVVDQHGVGGLDGEVRSGPAHRDAAVGGCHGGGVVDAISDEEDAVALLGQAADCGDLVLGEEIGFDVVDADLCCNPGGGPRVVTGQQVRTMSGEPVQPLDGPGAQPVEERDQP